MERVHTTVLEEHDVLRQRAGLVDHDGLALVRVTGPASVSFLDSVSTRSVAFLLEGQSSAALVLTDQGHVMAEVVVHCRPDGYLLEVWQAQAEATRDHLLAAARDVEGVEVEDVSARYAVLGVEGPASFTVVARFLDFPVSSVAYRSMVEGATADGVPVLVGRTGATGEYGYKLYAPREHADALRAELVAAGAVPVGLDAFDACRMEMRFVNIEREGRDGPRTPFHLGLQWMLDPGWGYAGGGALAELVAGGLGTAPVCWVADDDADGAITPGTVLAVDGTPVGRVTHAVLSPALGRTIGTAQVDLGVAASGLALAAGAGTVRTVSAPFLVSTSFTVSMD